MIGLCGICGKPNSYLHRDRRLPGFMGGTYSQGNSRYICPNCHAEKTAHDRFLRREVPKKLGHEANQFWGMYKFSGDEHFQTAYGVSKAEILAFAESLLEKLLDAQERQENYIRQVNNEALDRLHTEALHMNKIKNKIREYSLKPRT